MIPFRIQVRRYEMGAWWHEEVEKAFAAHKRQLAELDPEVRETVEAIGKKLDADLERRFLFGPDAPSAN